MALAAWHRLKGHMLERYYRILGIAPDAALSDVKSAYRKLVRQWHPDRHSHAPHMLKLAEETLKDANHAYREIVSHLAATDALTEPRDNAVKQHHAGSGRRHRTVSAVAAIVRSGKRLMDRICNTARESRRSATYTQTAQRVHHHTAPRFTATFGKVLSEVAAKHRLVFKNEDVTTAGMKHRKRVRRYRHPDSITQQRSGDPGPITPVDPVRPIDPLRRKR